MPRVSAHDKHVQRGVAHDSASRVQTSGTVFATDTVLPTASSPVLLAGKLRVSWRACTASRRRHLGSCRRCPLRGHCPGRNCRCRMPAALAAQHPQRPQHPHTTGMIFCARHKLQQQFLHHRLTMVAEVSLVAQGATAVTTVEMTKIHVTASHPDELDYEGSQILNDACTSPPSYFVIPPCPTCYSFIPGDSTNPSSAFGRVALCGHHFPQFDELLTVRCSILLNSPQNVVLHP